MSSFEIFSGRVSHLRQFLSFICLPQVVPAPVEGQLQTVEGIPTYSGGVSEEESDMTTIVIMVSLISSIISKKKKKIGNKTIGHCLKNDSSTTADCWLVLRPSQLTLLNKKKVFALSMQCQW